MKLTFFIFTNRSDVNLITDLFILKRSGVWSQTANQNPRAFFFTCWNVTNESSSKVMVFFYVFLSFVLCCELVLAQSFVFTTVNLHIEKNSDMPKLQEHIF